MVRGNDVRLSGSKFSYLWKVGLWAQLIFVVAMIHSPKTSPDWSR